jgi:hypothetical protein
MEAAGMDEANLKMAVSVDAKDIKGGIRLEHISAQFKADRISSWIPIWE